MLNYQWEERIAAKNSTSRTVTHIYQAVLNTETLELYHQDSNSFLFVKCCLMTLIRPLHTLLKTSYHLMLPLSLPVEIYKAISAGQKEKKSSPAIAWQAVVYSGRSLADIVRTPLCGIALETLVIVGALLAAASAIAHPSCTRGLYWLRATAAKVELWLNWQNQAHWMHCRVPGQQHKAGWILAPCFQPLSLMSLKYWNTVQTDTLYPYPDDALQVGLTNYVRKLIIEDRN